MKLVFWLCIALFLGHLLHGIIWHGAINYEQAFERIWFQFWALLAYWLLSEKV